LVATNVSEANTASNPKTEKKPNCESGRFFVNGNIPMTQKYIILVSTTVQASNVTNACHKVTATTLATHMTIVQNFTPLLKAQLLFNSAFTAVNCYLPPFEKGVCVPTGLPQWCSHLDVARRSGANSRKASMQTNYCLNNSGQRSEFERLTL